MCGAALTVSRQKVEEGPCFSADSSKQQVKINNHRQDGGQHSSRKPVLKVPMLFHKLRFHSPTVGKTSPMWPKRFLTLTRWFFTRIHMELDH